MKLQLVTQELAVSEDSRFWEKEQTLENWVSTMDPALPGATQEGPSCKTAHVLSCFGHVQLFATLWILAHQAPPCMGFFRQEYWSGLLRPPPRNLPYLGIEPMSPGSPMLVSGFCVTVAAAAKLLQSCPTLCNPTDGSPPGSPVPGILQARTLEWVAISFSNA